tara:strand:+ start:540 stop:743 length:204 start_codon:yes stop_codon:yes gene_type:complete
MTDLKHFKVEEYLIKESYVARANGIQKCWIDSHYKYHGSFDTRKEAEALFEKLRKRPAGYTHYRITY